MMDTVSEAEKKLHADVAEIHRMISVLVALQPEKVAVGMVYILSVALVSRRLLDSDQVSRAERIRKAVDDVLEDFQLGEKDVANRSKGT